MQTTTAEARDRDKELMEAAFVDEPINVCQKCNNIYKNLWVKTATGWNDFGFRFCPFCGAQTEDFAHIC